MAKKNFSAGSTKSGVLNNDGGEKLREIQAKTQYNFKYIPKDKIIPNPKNEQYTQDGIEALKESILVNGLRHNLSVLYDAGHFLSYDNNGSNVVFDSLTAIQFLIDIGRNLSPNIFS